MSSSPAVQSKDASSIPLGWRELKVGETILPGDRWLADRKTFRVVTSDLSVCGNAYDPASEGHIVCHCMMIREIAPPVGANAETELSESQKSEVSVMETAISQASTAWAWGVLEAKHFQALTANLTLLRSKVAELEKENKRLLSLLKTQPDLGNDVRNSL